MVARRHRKVKGRKRNMRNLTENNGTAKKGQKADDEKGLLCGHVRRHTSPTGPTKTKPISIV